ncbi:hypothetical protein ACFFLS_09855 [Flavobacterium procerum]|uniref:DUF4377 domain-containing protein n=1 Tax=Flavobacterium procerum TaxID=1455569 RepID=A0ABV6BPF9_9FLAO
MKTILLQIAFLLLTVSSFAQTQLLKDYDFNKKGYYILGTFSESDENSLRDSIGEFYTDDIAVLNRFKKDWVFKKPGKKYACGYHYDILVCRQGEILESFLINLKCKEIVTDKDYFYFDSNLLRQFYGKLKKPYGENHSFTTIQEARQFRESILNDTTLIMAPRPIWAAYEGSFRFTYKCKEGTKDCLDEDGKIFKSIEKEIKKKYPNEKFILRNVGGSWTTIELEITCNKSLSDNFYLYYRDKDYFGEWKPFDLVLRTYWTKKRE